MAELKGAMALSLPARMHDAAQQTFKKAPR
jgi:hypothetical protein